MGKTKVEYTNLGEQQEINKEEPKQGQGIEIQPDRTFDGIKDSKSFILNNILMSVQLFKNYERDIEILRDSWFKDVLLPDHHVKCFYADSIHKLVGKNVTFMPRHGIKKNSEELLHPLRIFVSSSSILSAYDPSALSNKFEMASRYQFTVTPCENNKKEKLGYVWLVQYEPSTTLSTDEQTKNEVESPEKNSSGIYLRKNFELKRTRRLTKTEKVIGLQSKELNYSKLWRLSILKMSSLTSNDFIPHNGFYNYLKPEMRLKHRPLCDFRMNNIPQTSLDMPGGCFQNVEVKKVNEARKSATQKVKWEDCFMSKTVLNSAAFQGYFCDILAERLTEPLGLNSNAVADAFVHEEFVTINSNGETIQITPAVEIQDWQKHFEVNREEKPSEKFGKLKWPTDYMQKIIQILPCYVVPNGYMEHLEENVDYEKEWKIVFSKAEEYLLLHMMHAHIRCYLFALAIYKSFIELETNSASFGPKHLLHLLFWRVHKDFLAWPEDRPGETLLRFLKSLYKRLRSKKLPDFFVTSRNLFANSLPKDLHKVQTITKMILENPIPYIMIAVRNLHYKEDFYDEFDVLKLNNILKVDKPKRKHKKINEAKAESEKKTVTFEDDKEREWRKNVYAQIQIERKIDEKEQLNRLSIDSINIEESLQNNIQFEAQKYKIVELFLRHFVKMGIRSVEYKNLDQARMYLFQTRKLINLCSDLEFETGIVKVLKIHELRNHLDTLRNKYEELKESSYLGQKIIKKEGNKGKSVGFKIEEKNTLRNSSPGTEGVPNIKIVTPTEKKVEKAEVVVNEVNQTRV